MRRVAALTLLSVCAASAAAAQGRGQGQGPPPEPARWSDRARVGVSAGVQGRTLPLSQSLELTKYVEPAPMTAEVPRTAATLIDAGVQVRLQRNLGVSVALSYLSGTHEAQVEGEIPHPLYFDAPRDISGRTSRIGHDELAVHTNLVYMLPMRGVDVLVFGGGSFFRVAQDFVVDVHFTETYPYDTATFARADLVAGTARATGFNVGTDITWPLGRAWGVGALVRYTQADVPFEVDGQALGRPRVGGLQVLGGVRVIVPVPRTPRP
jgi:hypothetical protein